MTPESKSSRDSDSLIPADANRRMFDEIARRYDLLNRLLSLGLDALWRRCAVRELNAKPGAVYLDVGCGTADLALEINRQVPGAQMMGIDVAVRMLAIGRYKLGVAGLSETCGLAGADAEQLPFSNSVFAGVVSAFCVRNLEHRKAVFEEISRVLKPDGRAVLLELTRPSSALLRLGHRIYGRCVVPLLGRLISRSSAYHYLIQSIDHFPAVETILGELRTCGFDDARARPLSGGIATLFVGTTSQ